MLVFALFYITLYNVCLHTHQAKTADVDTEHVSYVRTWCTWGRNYVLIVFCAANNKGRIACWIIRCTVHLWLDDMSWWKMTCENSVCDVTKGFTLIWELPGRMSINSIECRVAATSHLNFIENKTNGAANNNGVSFLTCWIIPGENLIHFQLLYRWKLYSYYDWIWGKIGLLMKRIPCY